MAPLVSIVIINWNGRNFLERFLPSVLASTYSNFNVVVADNASTDDSVPFMRSYYPQVRVIELEQNFGFTKGYNHALKLVNSDYYVLLNSDVEVEASWIEPVIQLMESDQRIGACQPKLLLDARRSEFEYAGACGGWLDFLGYPFARGRIFDNCETDEGQYDNNAPIFWASGAAMFIRSRLFHKLGGFDEYLWAHQEEIDLCWRMQLQGHLVYSCPASRVYHVGGGTLPKGNSRKVFLNFRNNLIVMAKNMGVGEAVIKISYRFLLDTVSAFKQLAEGEGAYFISVFKAHAAFLRWLVFSGRRSPRKREGVRLHGWLGRSVVWAHFVLGMKKFSEIVKEKD